jgi:quinol monooxygenase YgiN
MALTGPFIAATVKEDGVEFFEFHLSSTDPDMVIAVEGYRTPEVHDLHHQTAHFVEMWGTFKDFALKAGSRTFSHTA